MPLASISSRLTVTSASAGSIIVRPNTSRMRTAVSTRDMPTFSRGPGTDATVSRATSGSGAFAGSESTKVAFSVGMEALELSTNSPVNNTRSAMRPCRRQHNSSVKRPVRKVPPTLILASASPYRLGQLRQLGLAVEATPPDVDEAEWKAKRWPAKTLALELAIAKATAVAKRYPDAVIIGGDQ